MYETTDAEFVVGIGASAGGLEPLEHFFGEMVPNSGLAFVVVQHLSPSFKSLMDELLGRHTEMKIHRVEEGMRLEPDSVYLIPPGMSMSIQGHTLHLKEQQRDDTTPQLPIDEFFRSLAADLDDRAIGIVMSGTGSDGSRGIKAIRDAGGLTIAQDNMSAKFDGMPR
ncbi:MAG: chemotaxis protein CheB, partial [Planctomycetota bacterium]